MKIMTKLIGISWIVIYLFVPNCYVKCDEYAMAKFGTSKEQSLVDPHSLYYNRNEERIMTEEDFDMINRDEQYLRDRAKPQDYGSTENCMQLEIFYKRVIKLLLSNTHLKEDGHFMAGILRIEATTAQLETLQEFENRKISLREIDTILSDIIKEPEYNYLNEAVYITERIFQIMHEHKDVILAIVVTVLSLLVLKHLRWTPGVIILFTVLVAFLISFAITYMQLVQEAEIKLAAAQMKFSTIPSACLPEKMSWFEKITSVWYTNTDCEQYFKAVMTDAKLQVTPALVLSHLFSTVIFHPFSVFGNALSDFVANSTDKLPALIRWPVIGLLFIAICVLIIVLPICVVTGSFSLSLGPLFRISLGEHKNKTSLENSTQHERIECIREVPCDISKNTKPAVTNEQNHKCCCIKALENNDNCEKSVKNKSTDEASGDASANNIDSKITEVTNKEFKAYNRKEDEQEVGSGDA